MAHARCMLDNVVPYENTLFILLHFIYFIYVRSTLRTAGCISQLNKQEVQITCHSHSNSRSPVTHIATANSWSCRKLLLGECRKCWLWLRRVVWFCKATRERLWWAFSNDRHQRHQRRSKIHKMWALLLIIVSGSMVKFCTKLKCRNDSDYIWFWGDQTCLMEIPL